MELVLLKRESAEWNSMWERLSQHPVNVGLEEPIVALNDGEAWQYMFSFFNGNKILHEFRHRNHPTTNKVERIVFNGSDNFNDDQIEQRKKFR